MITSKRILALGGGLLLGAASVVHADATPSSDVQAQLDAMRARIAQLEGQQNDSWLNEKRAAEVKSLVRDVLADADTRASMAEGGVAAGYNNGFFIASEDGKFLLNIGGQIQTRYTYNVREGKQKPAVGLGFGDKNDGYFSIPRTRLFFDGHVGSPNVNYHIILAAGDGNGAFFQEATLSYKLADGVEVWAGRKTLDLVRDQMIDSRNLLMADRGSMAGFFGLDRSTGIGVNYDLSDAVHVKANVVDNSTDNAGTPTPNPGGYGVVARADFKVQGDWAQANDFSSWSGNDAFWLVGTSGAFLQGDHGVTNGFNHAAIGTIDTLYKNNGLSLYVAGLISNSETDNVGSQLAYGLTAQGSYMVVADKFEPFVRYDLIYLNHDNILSPNRHANRSNLITVGANYYLAKHAAKFTVDLQYALSSLNGDIGPNTSGTLMDYQNHKNQVALRGQFQLLF